MTSKPINNNNPNKSPILNFYSPLSRPIKGLLSIPHSGEEIPEEFHPYLSGDEASYKEDVDFQVHKLINIESFQHHGVFLLVSQVHRVAVDLNRAPDKSVLHWEFNTKGKRIRTQVPSHQLTEQLLANYYSPYYELLKSTLVELEKVFPASIQIPAIDLHSMPSRPTDYHLKINPHQNLERPDFCLSDLRGTSCDKKYINFVADRLTRKGHHVLINNPYFGGHVTEYMHKFRTNAIQIEIKRSLYMDEEKKELLPEKAVKLNSHLTEVLLEVFDQFSKPQ